MINILILKGHRIRNIEKLKKKAIFYVSLFIPFFFSIGNSHTLCFKLKIFETLSSIIQKKEKEVFK